MRVFSVDQGTEAWLALRLGVPTASDFHKLVTPKGKLSAKARGYAHKLVAEKLLGAPLDDDGVGASHWVSRGKELEPDAAAMYEFQTDTTTKVVGFITTDDGTIGCSPDRLVIGVNGAVEFKCYKPNNHVACMVDGFGDDHVPQVQGQMLVAELEWVDRFAYHPKLPPVLLRTHRDEPYIKTLEQALKDFNEMKLEIAEAVRSLGFVPSVKQGAAA